jgi:hypothetical protein
MICLEYLARHNPNKRKIKNKLSNKPLWKFYFIFQRQTSVFLLRRHAANIWAAARLADGIAFTYYATIS